MIINAQYFQTKELYIPSSIEHPSIGSSATSSLTQLEEEIESIEQSLLLDFLGYAQLQELNSQFETNGDWKVSALQKWKDLVDGKQDWKGLRYSIGTKKVSLIAYYVFFYYLAMDFQTYSTTGMQIPMAENSKTNDPSIKQVTVWNKFVRMYVGNGMFDSGDVSSNWNGQYISFGDTKSGNEVTLYKFLSNNKDLYDITFFTNKKPLNYYGL